MAFNRRELLCLAGGSAAGIMLTPVPWKLLDDSAIWTQNWSWTPRLPRGEVTRKFTACTLCPEACGVEARSTPSGPFALSGVAEHPTGRGVLCPSGVTGHHVAYHPSRVRRVLHRGQPAELSQVIDAIRARKGALAILDERPGRAISEMYRRFLAEVGGGLYLTPGPRDEATLEMLRELVDAPPAAFGIDLERTSTLLSFGAPVLDGWAAPGRVWAARQEFRLIQVEPRASRTANLAEVWLPIRPGTEAAIALGIAHILLRDNLAHPDASRAADFAAYRSLAGRFTPEVVANITGVEPGRLLEAAREFAAGAPAVAIGGGDPGGGPLGDETELAIAGLNLLAGSAGRRGGIVPRRETFERRGTPIAEAGDGSIAALIVDAFPSANATPWEIVKRKLSRNAVVISLAAFPDGLAGHADFIVPTAAHLESLQDAVAPFDAPRAMFSISAPLLPLPPGIFQPADFLAKVAEAYGASKPAGLEAVLKERVAAVHKLRRGSVFSYAARKATPLAGIASADQLWTALSEGGCWIDDEPAEAAPGRFRLLGKREDIAARMIEAAEGRSKSRQDLPLALVPHGWRSAIVGAPTPLMTKLYQESGLRSSANEAAVHPDTARACDLPEGCAAVIETACGACRARVRVTSSVMPGAVEAAITPAPGVLDVCNTDGRTWRLSAARIRRA